MTTRLAYSALVLLVAVERLVEMGISARHVRRAKARGAVEAAPGDYRWMVALHAAFLPACVAEVWAFGRPWRSGLGLPMLALVAAAGGLRYWVMGTLGERWTTRVVYVPGDAPVRRGPFRFMRHPNYAAVVTEIAALPLVHGAWMTALGFSIGNAFVLGRRIAVENDLLRRCAAPSGEGTA